MVKSFVMLVVLAAAGLIPAKGSLGQQRYASAATVIDGASLVVAGTRFRLFGIEVPDPGQVCERFGRAYPCGLVARTALMDLVAGARVICRPVSGERAKLSGRRDPDGATVALCKATGVDLSWNMVHTGWALANPDYGRRYYGRIEASAKTRRAGLWRGRFTPPWKWRAAQASLRKAAGGKVCVRGTLTSEGVECQALRGVDGKLYTLGRPKIGAKTGSAVCACGRVVAVSTCMQGTTIAVTRMRHPSDCPQPK